MALNIDARQAFLKGQECLNNNDCVNARHWYEISYQDDSFKLESLARLIQIEIKEGNYAKAREILKNNKNINSPFLKKVYGLLESAENNFEQSKKYYSECMCFPNFQYVSLLALAKLYIQTGDYDVAIKMLQTLQFNSAFYIRATFELIYMNLLTHDFSQAQQYIMQINESKLYPNSLMYYKNMKAYVKYCLGQLKFPDSINSPGKDYIIYRLFDHSDDTLLNHIEKHKNQSDRATIGCFFKHIDTKKLLMDAKEIIENMNGNHFEFSDVYNFRLNTPIGYKRDLVTSDLCVVTITGTKDIITMYPVSLSDEYDKEGFAMSEQLRLKRSQGGIR